MALTLTREGGDHDKLYAVMLRDGDCEAVLTRDGEAIGYHDPDRTRFATREAAEIAAAGAAECGWQAKVLDVY